MKRRVCIAAFLLVALFLVPFIGCRKDAGKGILGIVVPIGQGKVTKETPYLISGVYEGSPAHQAGILPGDIILEVDGASIDGMSYDEVYRNHLIGPSGTTVELTIRRGEQTMRFRMTRIK